MPDPNSNPPVLAWTAAREAELERLLASATPGPWDVRKYTALCGYSIYGPTHGCIAERWYEGHPGQEVLEAIAPNASFIAASRTAIPDLLAHSKRQAEAIRGLVGALERIAQSGCGQKADEPCKTYYIGQSVDEWCDQCVAAQALAAARELEQA